MVKPKVLELSEVECFALEKECRLSEKRCFRHAFCTANRVLDGIGKGLCINFSKHVA